VLNLFQLEVTAKQPHLERFGAWLEYESGDGDAAFGTDEQLFDHRRVADVLAGDV
jgi:hypothetical protein